MGGLFGGGGKSKVVPPTTFERLPAVSPNITTGAGSFINADLTFGRRGPIAQPIAPIVPIGGISGISRAFPGAQIALAGRATGAQPGGPTGPFGLTGADINIGLSPEIAALREESLGGTRGLLGDLGGIFGDIQGDITALRGQENPFIQARVSPFVAAREQARRDAIRRGVAGPLTALATNPFEQQIAEQGALAAAESQTAIAQRQQLLQQNRELARGLVNDVSGQGQQLLQQELQLLGLGQQEIRDIVASQLEQTVAGGGAEQKQNADLSSLVGAAATAAAIAFCWVAREVYGEDNPRWKEFRRWLMDKSPWWFRKLYIKHGKSFAGWIHNKPRIKRLVRGGMEGVLRRNQEINNG